MPAPNLQSLFLTPEELAVAEQEIKKTAFRKWEEAGSPEACGRDFWTEAQEDWIETRYVPNPSAFLLEDAAA